MVDDARRFRMDEQRDIALRQDRQGSPQIGFIDRWKFVDTRRHQKALEPANAGGDQCVELAVITGHDAAPEPDVDVTLPSRRRALRVESSDARRRRHAVQRHVDDRRHAARRRGARRRIEAFPLGAPRLVDVDVCVDDARRDDEVAGVEDIRARGRVAVRVDGHDRPPVDVYGGWMFAFGKNHAAAADNHRH